MAPPALHQVAVAGATGRMREDGEERLVRIEEVQDGRRVALSWCAPGGVSKSGIMGGSGVQPGCLVAGLVSKVNSRSGFME